MFGGEEKKVSITKEEEERTSKSLGTRQGQNLLP
jgi:hypothetical protein